MAIMEPRDRIHLRDYIVSADIGAFQSERGAPQRLRFNIVVELHDQTTSRDDQVDGVLSYDVLTQAVASALADQRYNLVETLAEKIASEVLAYPRAARIEVTVEKLDRIPGALGVTICRTVGRMSTNRTEFPVSVLLWQAPAQLPQGAVVVIPDASGPSLAEGDNARRITMLALDQAAWALAGRLNLEVAESRTELDDAIRAARPVIWAPARLAADIPEVGASPLQLAGWLADRLGAGAVLLALPDDAPLPESPAGFPVPLLRAAQADKQD